ncbi:MAG: hypothetical protein ACI892_000878, partial [Marinobacter maritimus]
GQYSQIRFTDNIHLKLEKGRAAPFQFSMRHILTVEKVRL